MSKLGNDAPQISDCQLRNNCKIEYATFKLKNLYLRRKIEENRVFHNRVCLVNLC